ncbi:uncharacterized protein YndB with AHSA1/START domain [Caulobacter ginsengisoli]|uniref:Uncharacterized protein YndB with AHSA1/START domain n=1 Tax=Caulobacter ginsengisoli TaxID=400775 RepID=A0ABU0IV68_9CAUL|nr:SRPBCC family protein [Caulobacter ginsengisoli]MDQ0465909.1 uncharacterized protein YndB with AHSA1/START domain [Caulobacter ginsengisoli]
MSDPAFVYVVYIRATPARIWDALTDPDQTEKFWFGGRFKTDGARKGSDLELWSEQRGVDFTGQILESDPPKKLVWTFQHTREPDSLDGATTVSYELEVMGDDTRLTVTHDGFLDNSSLRRGVSGGWPRILSSLKSMLETGAPLTRAA